MQTSQPCAKKSLKSALYQKKYVISRAVAKKDIFKDMVGSSFYISVEAGSKRANPGIVSYNFLLLFSTASTTQIYRLTVDFKKGNDASIIAK